MKLTLNKDSEVPLHKQIGEQFIFQIVTGAIRPSETLPSVRALARRLHVHHNTVSRAYADLASKGWLRRKRGARLQVDEAVRRDDASLDGLIAQAIRRAQSLGFSIEELERRVIERLSFAPPRYVLVVDEEKSLGNIIQAEIEAESPLPVRTCSPKDLAAHPEIANDALLIAIESTLRSLPLRNFRLRSESPLRFSSADEHLLEIRSLKKHSTIGVVSYSPRFLQAARALISTGLGEKHSFREFLLPTNLRLDFKSVDLIFCDSLAFNKIRSRRRRRYRIVDPSFLSQIIEWFFEPRVVGEHVRRRWKVAQRHEE